MGEIKGYYYNDTETNEYRDYEIEEFMFRMMKIPEEDIIFEAPLPKEQEYRSWVDFKKSLTFYDRSLNEQYKLLFPAGFKNLIRYFTGAISDSTLVFHSLSNMKADLGLQLLIALITIAKQKRIRIMFLQDDLSFDFRYSADEESRKTTENYMKIIGLITINQKLINRKISRTEMDTKKGQIYPPAYIKHYYEDMKASGKVTISGIIAKLQEAGVQVDRKTVSKYVKQIEEEDRKK